MDPIQRMKSLSIAHTRFLNLAELKASAVVLYSDQIPDWIFLSEFKQSSVSTVHVLEIELSLL
jgi:hypothetical protein